jgi:hypothetical protein
MSPCVATTFPSLVPTFTEQPVPQKRQGAFSHVSFVIEASVTTLLALIGIDMPAAAAAEATACDLINFRRETFIITSPALPILLLHLWHL